MVVEGGAIAGDDLWDHVHFLHGLSLECVHIKCLGGGHLVIVHVEDRRA
jgi:hypothetical protein